MNSKPVAILLAFLLLAILHLTAWHGHGHCAAASVYVVDIEKALTRSKAALAGQNHVKEARKALEQGFEQLRKLYDGQPEEVRQRILSEGANALTRQLNVEQQAVNAVITQMMLEVIRDWRKANKADIVVARQNLLDAGDSVDITNTIIQGMDARQPQFADLPVVNVTPPSTGENPQSAPAPAAKRK